MGVKGVVLAAGYGTRFLPVTKAVPKELLPLVDRPSLDWVVAELEDAGVDEILVVSSSRKGAIKAWFGRDLVLEDALAAEPAKLDRIRPRGASVSFVHQDQMRGTGHAILLARDFVGDEPFVVAYPDDLFPDGCAAQLLAHHRATGRCVLAAVEMEGHDLSRYGVIEHVAGRVRRVVEKPRPGQQPSQWVSLGRYVYTKEIFPLLEAGFAAQKGGEFYPMAAIEALAVQGKVDAVLVPGRRWDTGTPLGLLQAGVEVALSGPEGPALRDWLRSRL